MIQAWRTGSVRRGFAALATLTLVTGVFLALDASPAHAATFTVNSTDGDGSDIQIRNGFPGDGICDVDATEPGPQCTIRAAIGEANYSTGVPDVIEFDLPDDPSIPGNEVRTIRVGERGTGTLPPVTDQLTIDGYSQGKSTTNTTSDDARPNTLQQGSNARLLVELSGQYAGGGTGLMRIEASDSVVKGLVINRFFGPGVLITGSNNKVEGNFIGTDPSGQVALGNNFGVSLGYPSGGSNNVVGGTTPATRNVISGNKFSGIEFANSASLNRVEGNLIGTQKDSVSPLGNSEAGVKFVGAGWNTIGGTAPGAANIIAHNAGDGIVLETLFASNGTFIPSRNRLLSNSIYSNAGLSIDLGDDGTTANDEDDPDTGANNLQNYPLLSSAKYSKKKGTIVRGTLNSTPGTTFTLQFFSTPSGDEEGKKLLGQKSVATDSGGDASFTFKTKKASGEVTATATKEATGDTSEFSAPKKVVRR